MIVWIKDLGFSVGVDLQGELLNQRPYPQYNEATTAALEDSIAHWRRLATGSSRFGEDIYSEDCALCSIFLTSKCQGCPVSDFSGHPSCSETPWSEVSQQRYRHFGSKNTPGFLAAALVQLQFLEQLHPLYPYNL